MLMAVTEAADRHGGDGGPHFFIPLLLLLLIGFFVVRGVRRRRGYAYAGHGASPMATLQDRFARGEIDRKEFEYRRAVLRNDKDVPSEPRTMAPPQPPSRGGGWTPPPAPPASPTDQAPSGAASTSEPQPAAEPEPDPTDDDGRAS